MVGDASGSPGLGPLARRDVGLGTVQRLTGGLDVDEGIAGQQELDLRASGQELWPMTLRSFDSRTLRLGCWSGEASSP